jgi:hypothetical protein
MQGSGSGRMEFQCVCLQLDLSVSGWEITTGNAAEVPSALTDTRFGKAGTSEGLSGQQLLSCQPGMHLTSSLPDTSSRPRYRS